SNSYTNNNTLSFSVPYNTNVTFNATANQFLTTCSWTGATQINCTANTYAYKLFDTAGTKYVNLSGSNANGSTLNSVNWTIIVEAPLYIPPVPVIGTVTTGNFWKNITWTAGVGNTTNSYNVSRNGTWFNATTNLFLNTTTSAHAWMNDTIYAYNSSGTGTLNTTALTNNTRIPNNIPIQSSIGNKNVDEGTWLNFTISSTDADGDSLTYGTNASKGTLTGVNFNWSTTYTDSGVYTWYFNTTDNYSAVATETITVTVNNITVPVVYSDILYWNSLTIDNSLYVKPQVYQSVTYKLLNTSITTTEWKKNGVVQGETSRNYTVSFNNIGHNKISAKGTTPDGVTPMILWNILAVREKSGAGD
ncbi:MAG: hypothetical protein Q8K85_08535, partial [Hyphomicrobium sp.]|nr:hypothetical protein [Hyphomicrobium sp.]